MGFDPKKFKAPVDNGRWAETDLINTLKIATTLYGQTKTSIATTLFDLPKTPIHAIFKPGVDYTAEEINENGAHVKLHTNLEKIDHALEFINSGKHPLIKEVNFNVQVLEYPNKYINTIALCITRIDGNKIIIRYNNGRIERSIVETVTITRERPI